jgi:beta-glucanase (GH16 family)
MRLTPRSAFAFTALLLAPLAGLQAQDTASSPSGPASGTKWKLAFGDEFDGKAIDEAKWKPSDYRKWDHPGFKTRLAKENCALDGHGNLVIRLTRDEDGTIGFNGGLISRDFQKAFGYLETRAQFSTQPGWWGFVCTIRNNKLPNYGHDTFENPQEFDIFEDFHKPKIEPSRPARYQNVICQAYHATVGLGFQDQGDGSGATVFDTRKKDMRAVTKPARILRQAIVPLKEYGGWHTVGLRWGPLEQVFYVDGQETMRLSYKDTPITNIPQKLFVGSAGRTPPQLKKDGGKLAFYGWLEDAKLPDRFVVDYVRWYDEDHGDQTAPSVTLTVDGDPNTIADGQPTTFRVHAEDKDGKLVSVQLFAKGYLRAETEVGGAQTDQTFTLSNLFEGDNTLIATAVDDHGHVGLSAPVRVKVKSSQPRKK